jgi:galactose-1-phosphate uridylyltransferase
MKSIRFEKRTVTNRIQNPLEDFKVTEEIIEVRTDPLLGYTTRILGEKGLDRVPEKDPLLDFVHQSAPCFFCEERLESQTPIFTEDVYPEGRIRVGEAVLFPNLAGYGRYSGVCILSTKHFTTLKDMNPDLIGNALKACRLFFQICSESDNDVLYPTVNWNYLLPAGSSLLHPHLQPILDPVPSNIHRLMLSATIQYYKKHSTEFWPNWIESEKNGPRFLHESDHIRWLVPFAPVGFNEINAIIGEGESFDQLTDDLLEELSLNLCKALHFYDHILHNSFNMTLFSSPIHRVTSETSMPVMLKIATRPVFQSMYRNDVTYFERFHQESVIDQPPEKLASEFKSFLASYEL